ncbi:NUDIX hydrolase [Corynebacterium suicordis]|nr:NUDIX domain-containing protein [Corynebacterium suicordis]MDR6277241.1 8-oxo-dGTP pyrophosphatase MutT (NUDIX family) [Corynebacterium suicordis]
MPEPVSSRAVIEVSAVVFFDAHRRMLTVRKRGTELFMHPGGKPEPGESSVETAVREVAEELGVRVRPTELTFLGTFVADAANEADTLVKAHLFEYRAGDPAENAAVLISHSAAEIEELRWLDFSEGVELPNDLAPLVTEAVLPLYGRG